MLGSCRLSKGSKMQNIEPKFDPFALSRSDWPGHGLGEPDARRVAGDPLAAVVDRLGPLERDRVGQLDVGQQIAHVLGRDEARRASC